VHDLVLQQTAGGSMNTVCGFIVQGWRPREHTVKGHDGQYKQHSTAQHTSLGTPTIYGESIYIDQDINI
jgi:hypothetical protein